MAPIQIKVGTSKPRQKGFHIFSWFIRFGESFEDFLKTKKWKLQEASHMYIQWHSKGADVDITYHATGTGIMFLCRDVFDTKVSPIQEFTFELESGQYKKLLKFCMTNAGKKYGVKGVIGLFYVKILNLFGCKKRNPFSDGFATMWCDEMIGYFCRDVLELKEAQDVDWETYGVNDTIRFLESLDK